MLILEKSLASLDRATALIYLLFAFLEAVGEIGRAFTAHIYLNLVKALALAAGLSPTHLLKRELLRRDSLLFQMI